MKLIPNIIITLTFPLLAISVTDCGNKKKETPGINKNKMETSIKDTFTYIFHDASVPPPYHRSYTIRVIPGQVSYAISDYDSFLAKDSLALTKPVYDSFVKTITDLHIKNRMEDKQKGCTGGTSDELILYAGSSQEVKGYAYNCGGQIYGNLEGDVAAATGLFKALIPDLAGKINATRNDN